MLTIILMVFAFVLIAVAAVVPGPVIDPYRIRLGFGGLAFWALSIILAGAHVSLGQ